MIPFQVLLDDHQGGMNLHRQLNQILKSILRQKREREKKPCYHRFIYEFGLQNIPELLLSSKMSLGRVGGLWFSFVSYGSSFVEQNYW